MLKRYLTSLFWRRLVPRVRTISKLKNTLSADSLLEDYDIKIGELLPASLGLRLSDENGDAGLAVLLNKYTGNTISDYGVSPELLGKVTEFFDSKGITYTFHDRKHSRVEALDLILAISDNVLNEGPENCRNVGDIVFKYLNR